MRELLLRLFSSSCVYLLLTCILLLLLFGLACLLARQLLFDVCQHAREAHVHAFDDVRQLDVLLALLCALLDVVAWAWVVAQVAETSESIEAVPDSDVDRLPENAVSLLTIRKHLRVSARDV